MYISPPTVIANGTKQRLPSLLERRYGPKKHICTVLQSCLHYVFFFTELDRSGSQVDRPDPHIYRRYIQLDLEC